MDPRYYDQGFELSSFLFSSGRSARTGTVHRWGEKKCDLVTGRATAPQCKLHLADSRSLPHYMVRRGNAGFGNE